MTRLLMTAGKGGVGKTTIAAATAVALADLGRRTLVMSIDSAHNLADVLGVNVGSVPTPVADRLFALEVDLNRELTQNWDAVMGFFRALSGSNPLVTDLAAEESAVFPGMEELFGLCRILDLAESGDFDVVVIDAPPTGDFLKLLRLPEVMRWFVERTHPFDRGFLNKVRPIAQALSFPTPSEEALEQMDRWYLRVLQVSHLLADPRRSAIRLVMTPDDIALAEARRGWSWCSLFGVQVAGVVVNRILPEADYPEPIRSWYPRQQAVLLEAEAAFGGLPVLRAPLQSESVIGVERLRRLAEFLFHGSDPYTDDVMEPAQTWEDAADGPCLRIRIPALRREAFRLLSGRDGLTLVVDNQRRVIPLPLSARTRTIRSARYQDDWLTVQFSAQHGGPIRAS